MWYVIYTTLDGRLHVVPKVFDTLAEAETCQQDFKGECNAIVAMRVTKFKRDERKEGSSDATSD